MIIISKRKVLLLIHTLGGGGAEKVLVNLANGMDKTKYDVTIMTVINTGIYRESINSDVNYKYIFNMPKRKNKTKSEEYDKNKSGSLLNNSSSFLSFAGKIYSIIWKYMPMKLFYKIAIRDKYDVEIAFLEGICAKIIAASNNNDSKKISWIHVDMINQPKSKFVFKNFEREKECYNKFDEIVCVSGTVREQFIKKFDVDERKVLVRYNPIDKQEIIQKAMENIDDAVKPDKFLFCSIGRLITQKGYDRLLRVHKKLIDKGYNYELWIIGEGTKRKMLEEYIVENNLQETVKLLGFKSNPYKYLNMADAFVCSSRAEGFSTVASEAVVLGKPIVTVDCSGMKELLGYNNEFGIVTDNNEESLANGMEEILNNVSLYNKYLSVVGERASIFELKNAVGNIEELC